MDATKTFFAPFVEGVKPLGNGTPNSSWSAANVGIFNVVSLFTVTVPANTSWQALCRAIQLILTGVLDSFLSESKASISRSMTM